MRQDIPQTVWVVDDDASIRSYLSDFLVSRGYTVSSFDSGEPVIHHLSSTAPPALLLLDVRMPQIGGLEVLAHLDKLGRRIPSIVLSGFNQVATVVQAMRLGASDYLVKPLEPADLEEAIDRVLEEYGETPYLNGAVRDFGYATSNKRMAQIGAICRQIAPADVPVLILGESGVGKEVLARYIHAQSGRRGPFVKVNCAALPADLLESELFGHERGAFTGAHQEKPGKFELAGHGTLMLDEVAEMSPLLQAKLLHILQDGEYTRLGGTRTLTSQARVLAATNKHLQAAVKQKHFREDLYFRLNVVTVDVPPLRERIEDILPLCDSFVEKYRGKYKSSVTRLPRELQSAFLRYSWPGNIRQLENAVRRFLILPDLQQALAELEEITTPPAEPDEPVERGQAGSVSLKEMAASAAERTEKELVFNTLNEVNWNRKEAARRLNICYKSLLNKLHRWQVYERSAEQADAERATAVVASGD
ncbi:MAG TPA: sigma-54 dependent transcriptional regulator [Bryobacteraceae bacterium]|nr:sigma-54 dependent transcriptional regulator [Bryobacteraceae bacterium]